MASHSKYCSPCPQLPREAFTYSSMDVVIPRKYSVTQGASSEGGSDFAVHKIPRFLRNTEAHKHENFSGHDSAID
jgi:hypothetical protein